MSLGLGERGGGGEIYNKKKGKRVLDSQKRERSRHNRQIRQTENERGVRNEKQREKRNTLG